MSLEEKNPCLADEFIALKARVKAEVARRCRNGNISAYAGSAYDYSVTPAEDGVITTEHVNKIMIPLAQINSNATYTALSGDPVQALKAASDRLAVYEREAMSKGASSSCQASCTGLCTSGCWDACTSCTSCSGCSGCSDVCTGCTGGCNTGCTGCSSTCQGGCSTGCYGSCYKSCGDCTGSCSTSCGGYCGGCTGSCTGSSS